MVKRHKWSILAVLLLLLVVAHPAIAQTPDDETPAEEQTCDKYKGEGARYGLCVAYCEAQDCDDLKRGDQSCVNLAQNFIDWSKKKGFKGLPKVGPTIDCRGTTCNTDDTTYCKAVEQSCEIGGECTRRCSSTFQGFDMEGKPMCTLEPICQKCVAEIPKIHE